MSNEPNQPAMPAGDRAAALAAARPKVRELLAEYLAEPAGDARAILETLLLDQMAGAPAREEEVLEFHSQRDHFETVASSAERRAQRIERRNRRLKRQLDEKEAVEGQVREYLDQARAEGKAGAPELTREHIIRKISEAIGIGGPLIPRVEKQPPSQW